MQSSYEGPLVSTSFQELRFPEISGNAFGDLRLFVVSFVLGVVFFRTAQGVRFMSGDEGFRV